MPEEMSRLIPNIGNPDLARIIGCAQEASWGGISALSTGEALAAALVLDRADWIDRLGFTLAQAIARIEPDWLALLPVAAQLLEQDLNYRAAPPSQEPQAASPGEPVHLDARLLSCGYASGCSETLLTFDLWPHGAAPDLPLRIRIHVQPGDSERIMSHMSGAQPVADGASWPGD